MRLAQKVASPTAGGAASYSSPAPVERGVEVVQVQLVHVLGEPFEDLVDVGVGRYLTKWAAICSMIASGAF